MDSYICINGKKIELTTEQLKALGVEVSKATNPFERQPVGKNYYYIDISGKIDVSPEENSVYDDLIYNNANYCTSKKIIQQKALQETLSRLLWRFSMSHGGDKIDLQNKEQQKYVIYYGLECSDYLVVKMDGVYNITEPFFRSKQIAQQAIEEVLKPFIESHPEFRW